MGNFGSTKGAYRLGTKKTVQVTQALINDAKRKNSGHCMIAEAVKELMPHAQFVSVDLQSIRWSDPVKGSRHVALTPRIAQKALIKWDQGDIPDPFHFQLRGAIVVPMQRKPSKKKEKASAVHKTLTTTFTTDKDAKKPNKATIVAKKNGPRSVKLIRTGGKTPPRTGLRRAFGLRAYNE